MRSFDNKLNKIMLIDTHAHLNDTHAYPDKDEIIARLTSDGVQKIVVAGYNRATSEAALALANEHSQIYAAIGCHPSDSAAYTDSDGEFYLRAARQNSGNVVAIGEIGLDYHYPNTDSVRQKEVFLAQLQLVRQSGLPVVIHLRDAFEDMLRILQQQKLPRGGLMHCYSGSAEYMHEVLKLGFDIALGGAITFKKGGKSDEVALSVPLDRLHLETDCPYLAPQPFRGKRNEPKYVRFVAEYIAALRGIPVSELAEACRANAARLFGI